jgi:NAD(P)-dependent dehydrogenase (short-subunit alcohol dehydrogenase family)
MRQVFISGGGSGIGLAIARAFVEAGDSVIVAGRNEAALSATGLDYRLMDVTVEDEVAAAISACPTIDVFVANAGGAITAPTLSTAQDDWDAMIALNLTSVWRCARHAVPSMVSRGSGRFIAVASTAAIKGYAYAGAYAAAKHGVLGLVRSMAAELAKTGVTANALCPGYTDTPMIAAATDLIAERTGRDAAAARAVFTKTNPMGRLIDPSEVAHAALWLASRGAASVNGQAIAIDGGETA